MRTEGVRLLRGKQVHNNSEHEERFSPGLSTCGYLLIPLEAERAASRLCRRFRSRDLRLRASVQLHSVHKRTVSAMQHSTSRTNTAAVRDSPTA